MQQAEGASPPHKPQKMHRILWRIAVFAVIGLAFAAGVLFLGLRWVVLPNIDRYRAEILDSVSQSLGVRLDVNEIAADWNGLRPRISLRGVHIADALGQTVFEIPRVDGTLKWLSLAAWQPSFYRLEISEPKIRIERHPDGSIWLAGRDLGTAGSGPVNVRANVAGVHRWLEKQREIIIRDAQFVWSDQMLQVPDLELEHVNFRLMTEHRRNIRYRLGLQSTLPAALGGELDIRMTVADSVNADQRPSEIYLDIHEAVLENWLKYTGQPLALSGKANLRGWLSFTGEHLDHALLRFFLAEGRVQVAQDKPVLDLDRLKGEFEAQLSDGQLQLTVRELDLESNAVAEFALRNAKVSLGVDQRQIQSGGVQVHGLDIAAVSRLAAYMPLSTGLQEALLEISPRGYIREADILWKRPAQDESPLVWQINAGFENVSANPYEHLPGVRNVTAKIQGDQNDGQYTVTGTDSILVLPGIFSEPELKFDSFAARGGWARQRDHLNISVNAASFANQDGQGYASGYYQYSGQGPGYIDLDVTLTQGRGTAVSRYLPYAVKAEVREWVHQAIQGGQSFGATLKLTGNLADFPFDDSEYGQFQIVVPVHDGVLHYAEGWPEITKIQGELRFDNASLSVTAQQGNLLGAVLSDVQVKIADLAAHAPHDLIMIEGKAKGDTGSFLQFLAQSPLHKQVGRVVTDLKAKGKGELALALQIPLHAFEKTAINGHFRFTNNEITVFAGMPALKQASGTVAFQEKKLTIPEVKGVFLGQPATVKAQTTSAGVLVVDMQGGAELDQVPEQLSALWHHQLSGQIRWQGSVRTDLTDQKQTYATRVAVQSDLVGLRSDLPLPLRKTAGQSWPLEVTVQLDRQGRRPLIRADLSDKADIQLLLEVAENGAWNVSEGGIAAGTELKTGGNGVFVSVLQERLDLDEWSAYLPAHSGTGVPLPLSGLQLSVQELTLLNQRLTGLTVRATMEGDVLKGSIDADRIAGQFGWNAARSALWAHLSRLALGREDGGERDDDASVFTSEGDSDRGTYQIWPAMNITVDQLLWKNTDLGKAALQAERHGTAWQVESLTLRGRYANLDVSGVWKVSEPWTEATFSLDSRDTGRFLGELGHPDWMKGGNAILSGHINWRGMPVKPHIRSLGGVIEVRIDKGQFTEMDPGLGRLLGGLNLQTLPRRLALDFKDVFSKGFVFDVLTGSMDLDASVVRTKNLNIVGPAAHIYITGVFDLLKKNQNLRVLVQPAVSDSVALGAATGLINPVAGVVTYVAQKALSNSFEKIFNYGFHVTGSWSDPKTERMSEEEIRKTQIK